MAKPMSPGGNPRHYAALRKDVEEAFLSGQRKIEEAKVQTYWRTGNIISVYLQKYGSRSEHYGAQVLGKLSADLKVDSSVLRRCVKFARTFDICGPEHKSFSPRLTWSHYLQLLTVSDEETRLSLMRRAEKSDWSRDQLAQKIRQEIWPSPEGAPHESGRPLLKLVPKKGRLYTYRVADPSSLHKGEDKNALWLDVGFQVRRHIPGGRKSFVPGQIVESRKSETSYRAAPSHLTEKDLYTYEAYVERELSQVNHIILTSSRSDKYGRYLADVFYGEGDGQFLNQRLLDEGLAVGYS